jgi:EpsI family protein
MSATTTQAHHARLSPALLFCLALMAGTWLLARWMIPTHYMADDRERMELSEVVPREFGDWREEPSGAIVVADPTIEETMNKLYSEVLNRTFVDSQGNRVMLSIAYGKNQNSNSTAAHRPEFCYSAQGFLVERHGKRPLVLNDHEIPTARLVGKLAERIEPITYWVTLDDTPALPGLSRKLQQLKYGLQGKIADGMLVRLSTIGDAKETEFAIHDRFVREWRDATPVQFKARFFGK